MLFVILFTAAAQAPQAAPSSKTMAMDDWHQTTIVSVGSPSPNSDATFVVVEAGDLDGDGVSDNAYLKLACTGGTLTNAWYHVKSPRDSASGMASGKRQHGPVTFIKEWGPSTPQLSAIRPTYDIKTIKSARTVPGGDGWSLISLGKSDGLCAAAGEASKAVKTKSNIQNN